MRPDPLRRLVHLTQRALGRLLDGLAGYRCAACDADLPRRAAFCPPCASAVNPPPVGARVHAAGEHGGPLATAIHRLKYGDRPDLARPLALVLAQRLPTALGVDLVVPVPLHARRLALRGYNQAGLVATELAAELSLERHLTALRRLRDTETQAQLGRQERLANVAGAFEATGAVVGRRVLVVDDVATTGATLAACRQAALEAGAQQVASAAVALTSARW